MNDITSKLRKGGLWAWNQKEKMFLAALLIVLCFRVYVVLLNPQNVDGATDTPTKQAPTSGKKAAAAPKAAPANMNPDSVPDPPAKPIVERAEDFRPLVRQNPFTIYGAAATGQASSDTESDTIDVTLNSIVKWRDGTYRADMTTKVSGKSKRYAEGEVFENYRLMSIDPENKTVQIYSSAHDKTFELKSP